jgi:acyl-CoA synthetase (AMP-forming)/AMP-acid ligase II
VPGHEVVVVDEQGEPLPDNEVGHVIVRGPSLMRGYFENDEATLAVVRDGWLWTGDLGFFNDRELYITGRVKDMIILRGRNIYAEDLERVAERVEGVRPGGALAFGVFDEDKATEVVVMVLETREREEAAHAALAKRVSQMVVELCDVRLDEIVMVAPRALPKTSSGKKQRSLARKLYLKQELHAPSSTKLGLAMIYARSRAGYLLAAAKKLFTGSRREPV